MQITEKLRNEILLSLPKLSLKDADKIAADINRSRDTVYREYSKLKTNDEVAETDAIFALLELAAAKKPSMISKHKRARALVKQLSGTR